MDKAMELSELLKETTYIAKLSGRIILMNLNDILAEASAPFDFLCDMKDHGIYNFFHIPKSGRYIDTRFFIFTRYFYGKYLKGLYKIANEGRPSISLEGEVYNAAKKAMGQEKMICRFSVEPIFAGRAGHMSKDYDSAPNKLKRITRSIIRKVFPKLYI
jgi:hypothetical protein